MAFAAYCKIDGIPGDSTVDGKSDYFELTSYSHDVAQAGGGEVSAAGGLTAGRPDHGRFVVTKALDKASPVLAQKCSQGTPIPNIVVELWANLDGQKKFMQYTFSTTMLQSVSVAGGSGGADRPAETVTFAYAKVKWEFTGYDNSGKKVGQSAGSWDLAKNLP
jgi:type VI secretion system secreted protein Hcp